MIISQNVLKNQPANVLWLLFASQMVGTTKKQRASVGGGLRVLLRSGVPERSYSVFYGQCLVLLAVGTVTAAY